MNPLKHFSKTVLVVLAAKLAMSLPNAAACSAFCLESQGRVIVGKSYDWFFLHGHGYLYSNRRGVPHQALAIDDRENPAQWISRYGSLTFTQFGRGIPIGGINEKGLVVEMLRLRGTKYNEDEIEKPFVNEAQWTQYQLDNFASVAEAAAHINEIRVVPAYTTIHYFMTDASGQSAVVEYLDGVPHVYSGSQMPIPATTNNSYLESLSFTQAEGAIFTPAPASSRLSSVRFRTLAGLVPQEATAPSVEGAFGILKNVRLNGSAHDAWLEPSQWNIVYDVSERRAYFKTRGSPEVKSVALADFDFSPTAGEKMLDMNVIASGDVSRHLVNYSPTLNAELINENRWLLNQHKRERMIDHAALELDCARALVGG
ncbi:MAG: linear amide C-N hydrolase [Bdellovibrionales bacterium]